MIDPGDNAHTRWLDGLKPGDPVAHFDGRTGIAVQINEDDLLVELPGDLCYDTWPLEDLTQPPHPDLLALAARLPEDL